MAILATTKVSIHGRFYDSSPHRAEAAGMRAQPLPSPFMHGFRHNVYNIADAISGFRHKRERDCIIGPELRGTMT